MKNQFEIWAEMKELDLDRHPGPEKWGWDYYDIQTQVFWECWQAAVAYATHCRLEPTITQQAVSEILNEDGYVDTLHLGC